MANYQLNRLIRKIQVRRFAAMSFAVVVAVALISLLTASRPKTMSTTKNEPGLTGIVDESFTEANAESAMTAQQTELEFLKKDVSKLHASLKTMMKAQEEQVTELNKSWQSKFESLAESNLKGNDFAAPRVQEQVNLGLQASINSVSFRKKRKPGTASRLNPAHYVPSNTTVKAVVLGGADADASVNGQSKNNGVMLFKLLDGGSLPNGQRSRLQGCRVSANTYGDISSERAFATLYHLSCAHPSEPIIDKEITGWVFYNGKVGIKGKPLMRDNKIMAWAGMSGALSGVAQAAQYAQSIQQLGPIGASSIVPSSNIVPFAAYGGASKAADQLSEYYVKRAEQYHPVIQVGAGNMVTIVFKDGFYLEPDENVKKETSNQSSLSEEDDLGHFSVPSEVLNHIDKSYPAQTKALGGLR